jgi:hypothetical protein
MAELDGPWCFCRLCVPQDGDEELDEQERKLLADVEGHGWAVMGITAQGDLPGWAFTIGLWHTFRSPEVAMFGLRVQDMQLWLNDIGDQVAAGRPPKPGERRHGVLDDSSLEWRPVDRSWYPELFGWALWFTAPPLPIVQAVWPDRDGRYPWEAGAGERCIRDQPVGWRPVDEQPTGPWRLQAVHAAHGWPEPPELRCYTTVRFVEGHSSILGVVRDVDGEWQFLDGGEADRADLITVTHAADVIDRDPSLIECRDLPVGWEAWRDAVGKPWVRAPIDPTN